MNQVRATAAALVSPRWRWVTLAVIGLMLVLGRLGIWQLDRLEERRQQNAERLVALQSAPLDLNEANALRSGWDDAQAAELTDRDAFAAGSYDVDNQLILKLQTFNGQPGVRLITPFVLAGTDTAVLVDRGWISDQDVASQNFYTDDLDDTTTVAGYLAPAEIITRQGAGSSVPSGPLNEIYRVDIEGIQQTVPYTLLPMYLRQAPSDRLAEGPPLLTEKEVDLSEGPHLGYAIQWFIFSLGLGVAYVIFVNYNVRSDKRKPTPVETEDASTSPSL